MSKQSRRKFIRNSLAGGAGAFIGSRILINSAYGHIMGSNDEIGVAVVGVRGHGRSHINNYKKMNGVRIVALCDVDMNVLEERAGELEREGIRVRKYADIRRLLEDKDVHAISVATPNHWHALATVWGCQAGKDVCVEKPVTHSIWEGRKMVEAARRYDRVVQGDFDMRSSEHLYEVVDYIRKGNIGKIKRIRITNYKRRRSIGKVIGPQPVPPGLDYNLWNGPAPLRPLIRKNLHYDWHWVWATGNGEIGNNGPHQFDYTRWILGRQELPKTVMSMGGRYGYVDDGETPNTQIAVYDYGDVLLIYESRGLSRSNYSEIMDSFAGYTETGHRVVHTYDGISPNMNVVIFGEDGYIYNNVVYDNSGNEVKNFPSRRLSSPQHHFIRAVRSREREDIRTDIEEGHRSTCLCHMGNISYMLGHETNPRVIRDRFAEDRETMRAFERFQEHLAANEVSIWEKNVVLGPVLHFDSDNEQFTGPHAEMANRFVRDIYREPFVIPEEV